MYTSEENGVANEAIASSGYTAQCKVLLFCVKTIVKELCNFKLTHLKKKKKKEEE